MEAPGPLARKAFADGTKFGRGGKGSIYVFASGNGGRSGDNCNCDGYANSIYTIAIGAATEQDASPWYSEACAAGLAVTYSSGTGTERSITTVDIHNSCTNQHGGTSAAAPIAAGMYALVLEANPALTWRDVQHITVQTARKINPGSPDWFHTSAGYFVHHNYGFGMMDADKMVTMAQTWKNVGPQIIFNSPVQSPGLPIRFAANTRGGGTSVSITILESATLLRKLEHVQVRIKMSGAERGDFGVMLFCPSGTPSQLLTLRSRDTSTTPIDWVFMTVRCWDENPIGKWGLTVWNGVNEQGQGTLQEWELKLYGTAAT